MGGVVLDVEPVAYCDAALVLADVVAVVAASSWTTLTSRLDAACGMAGSDDAGAAWGAAYDVVAAAAAAATEGVVQGCYWVAALLEQSGLNYARAEDASGPGGGCGWRANRWSSVSVSLGGVSSAVGVGVPAPPGWSVLQHVIGRLWPGGHQDLLHAAADAWVAAGNGLLSVLVDVDRAVIALLEQRAPEVSAAVTVVQGMRSHVADLAGVYFDIADACTGYAAQLDRAHHAILAELTSFLEITVAIEAAGGLFALVTCGISELIAQGGETAEISRAGAAIRSVIETLTMAGAELRVTMEAVSTRIAAVSDRVQPILARHLHDVHLAMASDRGEIVIGRKLASQTHLAATPETAALDDIAFTAANDAVADLPPLVMSSRQIEAKFKHAADFGVVSPRGGEGFRHFADALDRFMRAPTTTRIGGTYRGQPAVLNFDRNTNLVVIQDMGGSLLSGWKMSPAQARHLYERGRLGGAQRS